MQLDWMKRLLAERGVDSTFIKSMKIVCDRDGKELLLDIHTYRPNAQGKRFMLYDPDADGSYKVADEHHLIPIAGMVFEPRATGGPVRRGGDYLVGDHGPEVFIPNGPGEIRRLA